MIGFCILASVFLLLCVVCLLQVRISAEFGAENILIFGIGPMRKQLYPSAKIVRQTRKTSAKKQKPDRLTIPKPGISDIRDAYTTLKPALVRALRRTRKGICVDPLQLSLALGGREDPAGAAELYGYIHAGVWAVMPLLEQLVKIPDPGIHWDIDFEADKHRLTGALGIKIRAGTLLIVAIGLAVPAVCWFRKYIKKQNMATEQPEQERAV